MTVSVVVPAYNEEKDLLPTLEALASLRAPEELEILIVDNASTDQTAAIAREFSQGRIGWRVLQEPQKGRGRARALGYREARGEIVFSTDADTLPPPDWVEKLLVPLADPHVVATVSPPYISDAGWLTNWLYNTFAVVYFWAYRLVEGNYPLTGFSSAVRKEVYDRVGGFNPELMAEEDIDLGLRVGKLGRIVLVRSVRVHTSGRRWQKGFFQGMWPYLQTTIGRLRGQHRDLSDIR